MMPAAFPALNESYEIKALTFTSEHPKQALKVRKSFGIVSNDILIN